MRNKEEKTMYVMYVSCEIGIVQVKADDHAIISCGFVDAAAEERANAVCALAIRQLQEYFAKERREFSLPLHMIGTPFQRKVWEALCTIPYGEVRSYGEIAALIGNEKASRAVGMANHRNPIGIIVPCHRVIGGNGKLVGYAGGLDKKRWLLELEQEGMPGQERTPENTLWNSGHIK